MDKKAGHLHDRTSEAISQLRDIDRRISRVTREICGSAPESGEQTPKPIEEHLHDKFDSIRRIIGSIGEEVTRLENAVGNSQQLQSSRTAVGY